MTFLEFCIAAEWGEPAQVNPGGRTWWLCQFHGDSEPSFATRPHDPQFPDRWDCFGGCRPADENTRHTRSWGDVFDFLGRQYPDQNYGWRREYVDHLHPQYEATIAAMAEHRPLPHISLLGESGGVRRQEQWNPFGRDFDQACRELWTDWPEHIDPFYEEQMLEFAAHVLDVADRYGVDPGWLRLAVCAHRHALKSKSTRKGRVA